MTERAEHTAGPWCIPSGDGNELVVCEGDDAKHPGKILFVLHPPHGTRHVLSYADLAVIARLVAVAPDLLAALQAVMDEWREGYGLRCEKQVRTAISRATGEA